MSSCSSAQKEKTFEFRAIRSTFPSKTISQRARLLSKSGAPPPSLMLLLSIEQAPHEPGTPQGGTAHGTSRATHSVPTGIATAPLADQGRGPLSPQSPERPCPQPRCARPAAPSAFGRARREAAAPARTCGGAGLLVPAGARSAAAARRPQERLVLSISLGPRVLLTLLLLLLLELPTQPHSPAGGGFHRLRPPPGRPSLWRRLREEQQPLIGLLGTRLGHGRPRAERGERRRRAGQAQAPLPQPIALPAASASSAVAPPVTALRMRAPAPRPLLPALKGPRPLLGEQTSKRLMRGAATGVGRSGLRSLLRASGQSRDINL